MADISIGVAADTRAFATGVRSGVLDPLEDVEKALDGVERASDDANAELVGGLKGAQRATKDLASENKDLAETIQREARKANRAVRDIGDEGFRGSSDAVRGFKDEAVQNFSEVASSFDGTIGGLADGVQGTLGGLASAITGPIGLALGGLGLIAGTVGSAWATKAEEIAADWEEMYNDMVESGQTFLSQDLINQNIQELVQDQGKLNAAIDESKVIGGDWITMIRAQSGDMAALSEVLGTARQKLDEQNAAQDQHIAKNGTESAAIADKQGQLEILIDKYTRMITAQNSAAGAADAARRAMEQSTGANNANKESIDRLAAAAVAIPTTKTVTVTLDTKAFYAEMENIRRQRFSITGDINWQHRGRQTID